MSTVVDISVLRVKVSTLFYLVRVWFLGLLYSSSRVGRDLCAWNPSIHSLHWFLLLAATITHESNMLHPISQDILPCHVDRVIWWWSIFTVKYCKTPANILWMEYSRSNIANTTIWWVSVPMVINLSSQQSTVELFFSQNNCYLNCKWNSMELRITEEFGLFFK